MRLLKDGRWKLTKAENARLLADPAVKKAGGRLILWGGATGDRLHPRVVKAAADLRKAVSAWVRKERKEAR